MIHLLRTLRSERKALAGILARAEDALQDRGSAVDLQSWIREHYGDAPEIPQDEPAKSEAVEEIIRRADKRRGLVIRTLAKCDPNPFVESTDHIDRSESV